MNTSLFIARRIGSDQHAKSFSRLIRFIAMFSISMGLAIMIISISVVTGFQNEIREKVIGFGSHIQITNFDFRLSAESVPIDRDQALLDELQQLDGIRHIQVFATKTGILKTDDYNHGVVFKGVSDDFDRSFFTQYLVDGSIPDFKTGDRSGEIIISAYISREMGIVVGQDVFLYFIQEPPRIRRFTVSAIYDTGLEELDRIYVLGDLQHLQNLNDWSAHQVGGFEVMVDRYEEIDEMLSRIVEILPYHLDAKSIKQVYPQLFDWLALLDMNVIVILVLMLLVASINMITTLLIAVLEKTNLIGVLKALGATNKSIRQIFLYHAAFLIFRGLLLGNLIGLAICEVQQRFELIKLAQESYYLSEVPVNVELWHVILLNLFSFVICMIMLMLPSAIVTRISPVKVINFR